MKINLLILSIELPLTYLLYSIVGPGAFVAICVAALIVSYPLYRFLRRVS